MNNQTTPLTTYQHILISGTIKPHKGNTDDLMAVAVKEVEAKASGGKLRSFTFEQNSDGEVKFSAVYYFDDKAVAK